MRTLVRLMLCLALLPWAARMGFSRGDKVIPQVVDGGGCCTTVLDLTNASPLTSIGNMWLRFYKNDGTKWILQTNLGTKSDFQLNLAPRQTIRIQTSGTGQLGSGYAIIDDEEPLNSPFSDDLVLGISAFYTYSTAAGLVDKISLPVSGPTALATIPVEINQPTTDSGLAIVNLAGASNPVILTLFNSDGTQYGNPVTFTLANMQQRSEFLDESLFPDLKTKTFKGMAEITANGPVAILGLLQAASANGVQFSTLAALDKESLRRDTYMVLLQAPADTTPDMPLDIDGFTASYQRLGGGTQTYPWDLTYTYNSPAIANRRLQPWNGAVIAPLGLKNDNDFDSVSLPYLKGLSTYSANSVDLSGSNLQLYLSFAVRTDLGNYAKMRIIRIIDTTIEGLPGLYQDLVLEVYIFK